MSSQIGTMLDMLNTVKQNKGENDSLKLLDNLKNNKNINKNLTKVY